MTENHVYYTYESPFGNIVIVSDGSAISCVKLGSNISPTGKKEASVLTDRAAKQLEEYFAGKRREFDVPLSAQGTYFQRFVWEKLQGIPYGETRSYGQVAQMIGNPKASRAVGMANNKNPIWIIIPCHRVIGADGSLTGYGGGLDVKKKLLELEIGKEL
jgi:methylated-DNA-[protein]-cysteine S-methyltransferase